MFTRVAAPATGRSPVASRTPLPGSCEERTARRVEGVARGRLPVEQLDVFGGRKGRAPGGAHHPLPTSTYTRSTDSRSRVTTAASRGARPSPPSSTSNHPTDIRSRAPIASPLDAHQTPPPRTCPHPTVSRPRATPSTLRAFHSSQLPHKGVLDATGDLPVAGAATRLNIRALWL